MNRSHKQGFGIAALLVLSLMAVVLGGCSTDASTGIIGNSVKDDPIKIGVISPLTGDVAPIGVAIKDAVVLAAEEVNAKGGIRGRQIQVIAEDGKCNGKDAVSSANKLINIDQVHYIVGGTCSSETLGAAPLAEATGTVLFSPSSSNPDISESGDFIFRDYPSDSYAGTVSAGPFVIYVFEPFKM